VKYADEAWIGLKNGFKVIKNSDIINKIGSPLLDSARAIGGYIKKAPDLSQYFRGKIKNIGDQIDNIGYNIQKVMGFEPELLADGVRIGDIKDIGKLNDIDAPPLNDIQKNYNKIVNGEEGIKGVSKANFGSSEKLVGHFEKHGGEFKGIYSTADEYLKGARDVMNNGYKVQYKYKGEIRTGYVRFMENSSKKVSKFEFVGTNNAGEITTYHVESGKDFWKMLNGQNIPEINPID
jgi:hypothetical protein